MEAGARNAEGVSLRDALGAAGLADVPRETLDRDRYVGYLEAHIEQGPYLEELALEGEERPLQKELASFLAAVREGRGRAAAQEGESEGDRRWKEAHRGAGSRWRRVIT